MTTDDFTYGDYLHIKELLALQHPRSEHPDELQFIIVHQAFELWFKLALFELERVQKAMDSDDAFGAARMLGRVHAIERLLAQQILILETMPPQDFHGFRTYLGTASGLQSYQFREMEVFSGLREERYLSFIEREYEGHDWPSIARHLDRPSLRETWQALLKRRGVEDVAGLYEDPGARYDLYLLAEALAEYDELFLRWRFLHIQLVERVIGGGVSGTGGTVQPYLSETLKYRFFPGLWDARNTLTERTDQTAE
jgi:tryptophan 2,3-dioxygenase